jgi:hypothetical protein
MRGQEQQSLASYIAIVDALPLSTETCIRVQPNGHNSSGIRHQESPNGINWIKKWTCHIVYSKPTMELTRESADWMSEMGVATKTPWARVDNDGYDGLAPPASTFSARKDEFNVLITRNNGVSNVVALRMKKMICGPAK